MRRAVIQFSHRLYLQKIKQWNYRQHCYPLKGVVKYAFAFSMPEVWQVLLSE